MDKPLQTVTMPILVPAWEARLRQELDGWVCLVSDSPTRYEVSDSAVRVATADDIQKRLTPEEKVLVDGALQLRLAYSERDDFFLERSAKKIEQSFARVRACVPLMERGPVKLRGNWTGVRWVYARLMSNMLRDARVVMWCSDKKGRFLPGVYCPRWITAAFVLMFMDGMRLCPHCGNWFIPKTDNQDYCEPSHGVNYRTARSRWNAKQRKTESKRAGKTLR